VPPTKIVRCFWAPFRCLPAQSTKKDPYTRGHSDRVTRYSLLIGKELNLPPTFMETLQISAQLHDVGKIGIEDRILKKTGSADCRRIRGDEKLIRQRAPTF